MIFLWANSGKIGSKLIRWGLGTDCSHFAVVFDEKPQGLGVVFHSQLFGGVQIEWWNHFRKTHKICHALRVNSSLFLVEEEEVYQTVVSRFYGQEYDHKAFIFWAYALMLYKMFGVKVPSINAWQESGRDLCTEIGKGFAEIPWLQIPQIQDYAMISPHNMYHIFKQSPVLEDAQDIVESTDNY